MSPPWVLGWGRWIDHAAERWTHLPCDAPLLTHGRQVAQNQLRGLGFSRAALSAARAKGQSELPPTHSHPPPGSPDPAMTQEDTDRRPVPSPNPAHLIIMHWFCLASSILAKARFAIAKRWLERQARGFLGRPCPVLPNLPVGGQGACLPSRVASPASHPPLRGMFPQGSLCRTEPAVLQNSGLQPNRGYGQGWGEAVGLPTTTCPNPQLRQGPRPQAIPSSSPRDTHGGFSARARPLYCCTCSGP